VLSRSHEAALLLSISSKCNSSNNLSSPGGLSSRLDLGLSWYGIDFY
jgi:hypothetical protein